MIIKLLLSIFTKEIIALAWGLFIDYLIASGYLFPQQRELWVSGGVQILGGLGAIVMISIYLHHKFDYQKQSSLSADALPVIPQQRPFSFQPLFEWLQTLLITKKEAKSEGVTPTP